MSFSENNKNEVMDTLSATIFWLVIIGCLVACTAIKDISLVCKSPSKSCTLENKNYLSFKTSKKVFAPIDVKAAYVETYQASTGGRRHIRFVPRHLVRFVTKDKKDFVVFKNYSGYAEANDAKQRIMDSIKKGSYPFIVKGKLGE